MDGLLSIAPSHALLAQWRALLARDPYLDLAAVADRLDVAEAELVASGCGEGTLRLAAPFGDLLRFLPTLGRVRAVTRNPYAEIETTGVYPAPDAGCAGAVGEIGARFLIERWRHGYALAGADGGGEVTSLRFYDERGGAVHDLHVEPETDWTAVARLVDLFASFDQSAGEEIVIGCGPSRAAAAARLRASMQARPVPVASLERVLDAALGDATPIAVAVRSTGVVQQYSGLVQAVESDGAWLAVAAPFTRVRVHRARIAEAWVVRAPSLDGPMTSLELLGPTANVVASIAGVRGPGTPEPAGWRQLLDSL
jgi:putative hemin transport protein